MDAVNIYLRQKIKDKDVGSVQADCSEGDSALCHLLIGRAFPHPMRPFFVPSEFFFQSRSKLEPQLHAVGITCTAPQTLSLHTKLYSPCGFPVRSTEAFWGERSLQGQGEETSLYLLKLSFRVRWIIEIRRSRSQRSQFYNTMCLFLTKLRLYCAQFICKIWLHHRETCDQIRCPHYAWNYAFPLLVTVA